MQTSSQAEHMDWEELPANVQCSQDKSLQCSLKPPVEHKGSMTRFKGLSKGVQVTQQMKSVACQCNILKPVPPMEEDTDIEQEDIQDDKLEYDPDWIPDMQCDESDEETAFENDEQLEEVDEELVKDKPVQEEKKFIVFESCLLALLSVCLICSMPCHVLLKYVKGSFVVVQQICAKGHSRTWSSQPLHGTLPQGNLQLAAGILFSGSSPIKVINMLRHINVLTIAYRTFNVIQSHYLLPFFSCMELRATNALRKSKTFWTEGSLRG